MSEERSAPWAFWGVLGVLAVAAVALLVVPGLLAPQPTPRPTASPTVDPHFITTDQGTFRFGIEGGDLVVDELAPTARELGRVALPGFFDPGASVQGSSGGSSSILACPDAAPEGMLRFYFGVETNVTGFEYKGPPAVSSFSEDGTWMVVLAPGQLDPGALLEVTMKDGGAGMHVGNFDEVLADPKTAQPSGCHLG